MKKILVLVSLFVALQVQAQETRTQAESSLMGLGMPGPLATEVAGLATGLGVVSNNVYLTARNAADSANINVLKVDGSDETVLNADTGDTIKLSIAGTSAVEIGTTGAYPSVDGDNSVSNLGTSTKGWKNIYLSDATNDAQLFVSSGLYVSAPTGQSLFFREASTDRWSIRATSGDLAASASGSTIAIQEATAGSACSGTLTLNATTPVVTSTTCATTGSRIFLTRTSAESTALNPYVSAISNGVSFSVTSEAGDTGTMNWFIIHEAP